LTGRPAPGACGRANRESQSSWKEFLEALKTRGLHGVEFVISDDHPVLKKAMAEVLSGVFWQRCYVHFLRNALDYVPRKVDDDCAMDVRPARPRGGQARSGRLAHQVDRRVSKLTGWVEENIKETLTYFRLSLAHRKHMKSTNMLERLNDEIRRRTYVARRYVRQQGDGSAGPHDRFC
jgi:putative transposase